MIGSKEMAPFAFHMNLGYIRNENTFNAKKNLWHASAAAEYEVVKNLKLVADVGVKRNPDPESSEEPVFVLGGIIYQLSENVSIDGGVKLCLTKPETYITFLLGTTLNFSRRRDRKKERDITVAVMSLLGCFSGQPAVPFHLYIPGPQRRFRIYRRTQAAAPPFG
jgi:hypothetical protein